jgi:hypothetical protein
MDVRDELQGNDALQADEFDLGDDYPGVVDGVRTRACRVGADLVYLHFGGAMEVRFRGRCA